MAHVQQQDDVLQWLAEPDGEPVLAKLVEPQRADPAPSPAGRLGGLLRMIDDAWQWIFGAFSLWVALAVLATLPVLQLMSLGYLLEVGGRIARTGRLRDGLVGMRKAARVGSLVLGTWLLLWLPRLAAEMWTSARLIDPDSRATRLWRIVLVVLTAWVVLHVAAAAMRGGRLRHFLWPRPIRFLRQLFQPGSLARARDAVWDFVVGLRLPYYFWLGLRGFIGGMVWLAPPITLLAAGRNTPALGFLGGALLALVVLYLPFLQIRMAAENRLGAVFEVRAIRSAYRRAPLAFLVALLFSLALALPLYLLKIELIPREAAWLPSLLFVASIAPARFLCGWALARAGRRERPRFFLFRWAGRGAMLPLAAFYVVLVYFTQYLSWYGIASLYEQHAFLVPVPFLGG